MNENDLKILRYVMPITRAIGALGELPDSDSEDATLPQDIRSEIGSLRRQLEGAEKAARLALEGKRFRCWRCREANSAYPLGSCDANQCGPCWNKYYNAENRHMSREQSRARAVAIFGDAVPPLEAI
jgi:hypothetical protein